MKTEKNVRGIRPSTSKEYRQKTVVQENIKVVTIPPDGGWAWVILFICCWNVFSLESIIMAYAVIQDDVMEQLKISGVQSSTLVSLYYCLMYLLGPFIAAFSNRYGFKIINILGGLIGGIALLVNYWSLNFWQFITCFTVFPGIAASLLNMVTIACPGYWFEAKRFMAYGVVFSINGITSLAFPPLFKYITNTSHWRWVFFVQSGFFFISSLLGFLIPRPPMMVIELEQPTTIGSTKEQTVSIISFRASPGKSSLPKFQQLSQYASEQPIQTTAKKTLSTPSFEATLPNQWSKIFFCSQCCKTKHPQIKVERPLYRSDIFISGSSYKKQQTVSDANLMISLHKITTERDLRQQLQRECVCCPEAMIRPLKEMLGLSLFKNLVFEVLLLDTILYFSTFIILHANLTRVSEIKGLGKDVGIFMLQLHGALIAVSRILTGPVFYIFPNLPPHYYSGVGVILGSVCQFLITTTTNTTLNYILAAAMGLGIGAWAPMRSVILLKYIGLDRFTNATGLLLVFQAIGALYGVPLAQLLSELLEEDYVNYYFGGIVFAMTGLLILPIDKIHKMTNKRN